MSNKKLELAKKLILAILSQNPVPKRDVGELAEVLFDSQDFLNTYWQAIKELEAEGKIKITYLENHRFFEVVRHNEK